MPPAVPQEEAEVQSGICSPGQDQSLPFFRALPAGRWVDPSHVLGSPALSNAHCGHSGFTSSMSKKKSKNVLDGVLEAAQSTRRRWVKVTASVSDGVGDAAH